MKPNKPKQWLIGHVINPVGLRRPKVFDKHGPEFILIDGPDEQTANENAALIAAAPDMLEALEAARDALVDCAPAKFKQPGWDILGLLHRIDHAIAKAKGGAE